MHTLHDDPRTHEFQPWAVQGQQGPIPVITGGQGVYFHDDAGRRYLDLSSQVFNVNLGYGHPKVVEAIRAQAEQLAYIGPFFATPRRVELGKKLMGVVPAGLVKAFFTNSGSEANEIAFAMARMVTGRPKIVSRFRSYHGTTLATLSVGGDPRRHALRPAVPDTVRFFDPYCYRCDFKLTYPECDIHCLANMEQILRLEGPENVAAVVVEPITGSNGCFVPPGDYLPRLRAICDRYDILLIADEVIDGFGRTGRWFAVDHWGVSPDILVVAKGITSGYVPLGAAIAGRRVTDYFENHYLPLGGTYMAHPLACAAACATLDAYQEEGLIERAARMGETLMRELKALEDRQPLVGDVRGLGLLACIELVRDRTTREPLVAWNTPSPITETIKRELMARGVFAYVRWNWIFISPPLVITEGELRAGIGAVEAVIERLGSAAA